MFFIVNDFNGQISIKGFVTDENDTAIVAMIKVMDNNGEFYFCDDNGYFNISIPNNSSILEFSAIKYVPQLIKIDSIDKNQLIIRMELDERYEDIVMIAPEPPFSEIGYYGRIGNQIFGVHTSFAGWSRKHNLTIDCATKDFNNNNFINLSYFPNIFHFKNNITDAIFNPYLLGTYSNNDSIYNSRALICNRIFIENFVTFNLGFGASNMERSNIIYNVGLEKRFDLPSINPYCPIFYQSFIKLDMFFNQEIFDWSGKIYFEFYNKSYRRLSFALGYESLFGQQDFIININFKNYIFKR